MGERRVSGGRVAAGGSLTLLQMVPKWTPFFPIYSFRCSGAEGGCQLHGKEKQQLQPGHKYRHL
jgi:hypothetical protein